MSRLVAGDAYRSFVAGVSSTPVRSGYWLRQLSAAGGLMVCVACPVCGKQFDTNFATAMPFCSMRCKQVDLGRWLNEEYGLPAQSEDEEFENSADAY